MSYSTSAIQRANSRWAIERILSPTARDQSSQAHRDRPCFSWLQVRHCRVCRCGIPLSALGALVLIRRQAFWQLALGLYLISLEINYFPMLLYAVAITRHSTARAEMGDELDDKKRAMAKYRRQSLSLLVPLLVPAGALAQERRRSQSNDIAARWADEE